MARPLTWHTRLIAEENTSSEAMAWDLLDGSGLAVEGATITRVIGRVDAIWTVPGSAILPRLVAGVITHTGPDPVTWSWDGDHEYLWWGALSIDELFDPVWSTYGIGRVPLWDTEGQRILGAGESVHAIARISDFSATEPISWLVQSRVLVREPAT